MDVREFVKAHDIRIKNEFTSQNPNVADENWPANHYKSTLLFGQKRMTTYFSKGVGLQGEPTAEEVLGCLADDAAGYDNASSFEEWCSEYGCDTDSRKAERTYKVIGRQSLQLRRFLGDELYNALLWEVGRL